MDSTQAPVLVSIDRGALGPGSGGVVIFADTSLFFTDFLVPVWPHTEEAIRRFRNALAYVGPGPVPPAACYANCDESSTCPILNVGDFICFLQAYAAGDPHANCNGSTTPPVLSVDDFICFQQAFAAGCP
jgi:hypothetical protein